MGRAAGRIRFQSRKSFHPVNPDSDKKNGPTLHRHHPPPTVIPAKAGTQGGAGARGRPPINHRTRAPTSSPSPTVPQPSHRHSRESGNPGMGRVAGRTHFQSRKSFNPVNPDSDKKERANSATTAPPPATFIPAKTGIQGWAGRKGPLLHARGRGNPSPAPLRSKAKKKDTTSEAVSYPRIPSPPSQLAGFNTATPVGAALTTTPDLFFASCKDHSISNSPAS